jgi:hypothetical protein
MRKATFVVGLAAVLGCGHGGVSKEQYTAKEAELAKCKEQAVALDAKVTALQAQVAGLTAGAATAAAAAAPKPAAAPAPAAATVPATAPATVPATTPAPTPASAPAQ